ncbi:MAG: tetratricopeptide repeat protein [Isosphaeraceae bacterium]
MTTATGPNETLAATGRRSAMARAWSLARRLYWPLVLTLIALNAWWAYDARPLPDRRTLAGLVNAGKTEEAESALRAWVRRSPHDAEIRVTLARLLAGREDYRGCAEQLRAVPFWSPRKPEALYREAQTWLRIDRARDAEAALRAYTRDDPNHPVEKPHLLDAQIELINLLTLENRWEQAREVIWRAHDQVNPQSREEFLVMSLRTILERSSPRASVETLRRYLAADPEDDAARLALAVALDELGRRSEADGLLAECLRRRPSDRDVWVARLEILHGRGDLDALGAALHEAPSTLNEDLAGYRAQFLTHQGRLEEAATAYTLAIPRRPGDADLLYRYALVAHRLGRVEEERAATQKHKVWRLAREALPDVLGEYGREGRIGSATPARRVELLGRLAELCRDLGMERDAREWGRLRDAERSKGRS